MIDIMLMVEYYRLDISNIIDLGMIDNANDINDQDKMDSIPYLMPS